MPWNSQYPPLPLPTCPCLFISTADAHAWPMRSHTSVTYHSTSLWAIHCCRVINGEGWAWGVEIACFDDHFGIAVCPNNLDIHCLRPVPLHNGLQCSHPKRRSNRTEFITCGSPWWAQTSRPIGLRARVSMCLLVCVASLGVKISVESISIRPESALRGQYWGHSIHVLLNWLKPTLPTKPGVVFRLQVC